MSVVSQTGLVIKADANFLKCIAQKIQLGVFLCLVLQVNVHGIDLGFRSECSGLTPADILTDAADVISLAGQTVSKFEELIQLDEELQLVLNNSRFTGVILVPENEAIIRYKLPSTQQELVDQFKLFVIPGDQDGEETRSSLQGSDVIMSPIIVANQFGVSVDVLSIQKYGFYCPLQLNISKFEVWIISDFLPLPSSPAGRTLQQQQDGSVQAPVQEGSNPYSNETFVLNRFLEQQNISPIPSPPPAPPSPPPTGSQCDKATPLELFERSRYVRRLAAPGAVFLKEQAEILANQYGNPAMLNYLNDANYEGVILVPNDEAMKFYNEVWDIPSRYANASDVALMHIIPKDLNLDVIGPIERTLRGDLVMLARRKYVENSQESRSPVIQIDKVGKDCEQFEFWILDKNPMLPPNKIPPLSNSVPTPTPTAQISTPPPTPKNTPSPPPPTPSQMPPTPTPTPTPTPSMVPIPAPQQDRTPSPDQSVFMYDQQIGGNLQGDFGNTQQYQDQYYEDQGKNNGQIPPVREELEKFAANISYGQLDNLP